ncbi:MAG: glycosyltransferase family 2 protein [Candidatus Sedimenticola sp. (ex Thyasira tokunagai)]
MKISIITVCFNSEETIRDTIESVLSQDYDDIEYLIIDGLSNDNTMRIVSQYRNKIEKIISEPDRGIYDAMNKGIHLSTGSVVGMLNSDDVFSGVDAISKLALFLSDNPDLDGAYADLVFVKRDKIDKVTRFYSSKFFSFCTVRFGFMCPHPTFYVKRKLFDSFGFYKLGYRAAADFELIVRFMKRGAALGRNATVMVRMREGGISTTGFWQRIHQNFEIVRACRENGIYTNIFMVALKVPMKLIGYLVR